MLLLLIVCLDIELSIGGPPQNETTNILRNNGTAAWELGACSSSNSIVNGATYPYLGIYTERCCPRPEKYTLVCHNIPPAKGWKNAYVVIGGHRYCDNFVSYKAFQKISITGKNVQSLQG